MERMPFRRPTEYYDEKVRQIDEKICELISNRKEISHDNPGYPPFEYIYNWAEKFNLYEELLKSLFGTLWNEKMYKPQVKPKNFRKNLLVMKSNEADNRIFSVVSICQYSNSSIINFNIDWDGINDLTEPKSKHTCYELFISEQYDCRMLNGSGSEGHFHYNFIVSPALPDSLSGIELNFRDRKESHKIGIQL